MRLRCANMSDLELEAVDPARPRAARRIVEKRAPARRLAAPATAPALTPDPSGGSLDPLATMPRAAAMTGSTAVAHDYLGREVPVDDSLTTDDELAASVGGIVGLTESAQPIVTGGTTLTVWSSVAFDATGKPALVTLSGGHFSATGAVTITFDLFDPIAGKVIRQAQRTYPAGAPAEPLPTLRRLIDFPAGPRVVQFRLKPSVNMPITVVTAPPAPDESPLLFMVEEKVHR